MMIPHQDSPTDEPAAAVRIHDLSKRYGRFVALERVRLSVPHGAVYGLLGLNGAGKTTTLECALGLLRPDTGRCEVLGCPAARIARLRGRVGVVFDRAALHGHLSVEGNLRICLPLLGGPPETGDGENRAARRWRGVSETLTLVGLERVRGRRARKLSLGMARRLAVARALLGAPELVVMDEPLAGLDPEGVERVIELIRTLSRDEGVTFVLSSHRLFEMEELCDEVGLIHRGRVHARGRLDALLSRGPRRLIVQADPLARAIEILRRVETVDQLRPLGNGRLEVTGRQLDSAVINESLVHAGVAVHALDPRRTTLHALFRDLTGIGTPAGPSPTAPDAAPRGLAGARGEVSR